jgi:hypothetical protein
MVFQVTSAADVPSFEAAIEPPPALEDVRVNGAPLGTDIEPSDRFFVTFRPTQSPDRVIADVSAHVHGRLARVRCVSTTEASIDVKGVDARSVDGSIDLTLHRLRVAEVRAPGLTTGELRFDLAVSGSVAIAQPE